MSERRRGYIPSRKQREKCAVVGVYGQEPNDAAYLASIALFALQHRGQEGSGIVSSDRQQLHLYKDEGLVSQVYRDVHWQKDLPGTIAIGHNRYGTSTRRPSREHVQPIIDPDKRFAFAHNGNIPDTARLDEFLDAHTISHAHLNDSEKMHASILHFLKKDARLPDAVAEAHGLWTGVYSAVAMDKHSLVAIRDPYGIRPLSIGRLNGTTIVASETCALDTIEADYERDVRPGEMVIIDRDGLRGVQLKAGKERLDAFEFVYFARPDSRLAGRTVQIIRERLGEQLAEEDEAQGTLPRGDDVIVVGVPDSGLPAALGYARRAKLSYEVGFISNRYSGRTFITPDQTARSRGVARKLNPLPTVKDKRVIAVDDSFIRGTTGRQLKKLLQQAGASEVHLRAASPPVPFPDFYGIDTPQQFELLAAQMDLEGMREHYAADSLGFVSVEGMHQAIGLGPDQLTTSCFTGEYPVSIGRRREEVVYVHHHNGAK